MSKEIIEQLLMQGRLKPQKVGFVQVEDLMRAALNDLKECQAIVKVTGADRAMYLMAYNAMLKAGRALLLFKGYRPDEKAQHKTVVEVTGVLLGEKYTGVVTFFEKMRRKRHELTYEANIEVSHTEAQKAFAVGIELVGDVLKEIQRQSPQMKLTFDINL